MQKNDLLIVFASWEDRFQLGFDRDLSMDGIQRALVFYYGSYGVRTQVSRRKVREQCVKNGVEYLQVKLDIEKPADNWRTVIESVEEKATPCQSILIDISTMPREIIWYILWIVEKLSKSVRFVYHSPEEYGKEWLSRDPRAPRSVFKLSGISFPSSQTVLLVTAGYDYQRVRRLLTWYEPHKSMIGIQSGTQFERNSETMAEYEILKKEYNCVVFEIDAFANDFGISAIREMTESIETSSNIVMSSLGPKLSAISLYKLQREKKNIGLVYAPSNQFNKNYSRGIGRSYEGII